MITDIELRKLRPKEKTFKVADRDGMYVTIATAGTKSFRYDKCFADKADPKECSTTGRLHLGNAALRLQAVS
jgi:hypothetical protein